MLDVEDWAEIRRLRRSEGMSISQTARVVGLARNTVKMALKGGSPPKYRPEPAGSLVDGVEPRIRELLAAYPTMPATVIAERVGWPYSIRALSNRVAELRPVYLPPDPASRTSYVAGEIAQCDFWSPDIALPVGFGQSCTATLLPALLWLAARGSTSSFWVASLLLPGQLLVWVVGWARGSGLGARGSGLGARGSEMGLGNGTRKMRGLSHLVYSAE